GVDLSLVHPLVPGGLGRPQLGLDSPGVAGAAACRGTVPDHHGHDGHRPVFGSAPHGPGWCAAVASWARRLDRRFTEQPGGADAHRQSVTAGARPGPAPVHGPAPEPAMRITHGTSSLNWRA